MTISVLPGTVADLPSIMPIMDTAFSPLYGEAWSLTQCTGALALSGTAILIARIGSNKEPKPCGFAIIRTVFDETELLLIGVDPDFHRNGVGTALVNDIVDRLAKKNVARVHVEVRHDNPALNFYDRHGFQKIGERHNYYRRKDGQVGHALTLSREIDSRTNQTIV